MVETRPVLLRRKTIAVATRAAGREHNAPNFYGRAGDSTIAALLRGYGLFVLNPAKWLSSRHSNGQRESNRRLGPRLLVRCSSYYLPFRFDHTRPIFPDEMSNGPAVAV